MLENFPNKIKADVSKKIESKFCQDPLFWIHNFEIWLPSPLRALLAFC